MFVFVRHERSSSSADQAGEWKQLTKRERCTIKRRHLKNIQLCSFTLLTISLNHAEKCKVTCDCVRTTISRFASLLGRIYGAREFIYCTRRVAITMAAVHSSVTKVRDLFLFLLTTQATMSERRRLPRAPLKSKVPRWDFARISPSPAEFLYHAKSDLRFSTP